MITDGTFIVGLITVWLTVKATTDVVEQPLTLLFTTIVKLPAEETFAFAT